MTRRTLDDDEIKLMVAAFEFYHNEYHFGPPDYCDTEICRLFYDIKIASAIEIEGVEI